MLNKMVVLAALMLVGMPMASAETASKAKSVLRADTFKHYIDTFNNMIDEGTVNHIPNSEAWPWLKQNIPLFECPDSDFERTYYYRWWTFRKHIKKTPDGFIITEFIRPVGHATTHNAISCALGHHINEGRWLHDPSYLDDYISFWLRSGEGGGLQKHFHQYSGWAADGVYERWLVNRDDQFLIGLLDALILDYLTWEKQRRLDSGMFWQFDVRDGMEESVSGSRKAKNIRPTINSYMYGNARAIARIATLAGKRDVAVEYEEKAEKLKRMVQTRLWDPEARFFKALLDNGKLADVREEIGFIPWYFNLPDPGKGFEAAWKQLMDPKGFYAPYGPTTAEQRHPGFAIATQGDDCQWNGPSWPFSTSMTLKALANLLCNYDQKAISKRDYFKILTIYSHSQRRKLDDGKVIPWIDENLNPFTGEWLARQIKLQRGKFDGRGDHYNHSSYCDLIITGLLGLRPREDDVIEVQPLLPPDTWDWFCLDNVLYHKRLLTILWDRSGTKYGRGKGLRLIADGKEIGAARVLSPIRCRLPQRGQ